MGVKKKEENNMAKKQIKSVKKKSGYEELFNVDRFYIYPFYFADISLTSSIKKAIGRNLTRVLTEFNGDHADYYADIEEVNRLGKKLFNRILKDEEYYKKTEKKILDYGDKLIEFCQKIDKNKIAKLTNQELYNIYHQYGKLIIEMRNWGWVPVVLDGMKKAYLSDYLMEQFKNILRSKGLTERKIAQYYSILTSSEKESEIAQEEITRLNLLLKITKKFFRFRTLFRQKDDQGLIFLIKNQYPQIYQLLKKHTQDFGWLTFYYIGPPMRIIDLIKAIRNDLSSKESISEQIKKIENHFQKLPAKKKKIIKELNLPSKIVYLLNVSSFFTLLKDHRKGVYQKSYVAMEPVIKEIAKRLNLSIKEVKYLIDNEIKKALLKSKDFSRIVKQRVEYCVTHVHKGKIEVLIGDNATQLINNYIVQPEALVKADKIIGTIAYSGKAKGIVKLVINKEDVDKVKEGDILVSPATNPDLIIAMKKAVAFVTDRGGITSHAAIVSRELKKPCIVGTGNATKILKDGDLVAVDAENGVVIKLNR